MYPRQTNRKNDPGFYVFNFTNKSGFALISGDKRIAGRLGWSGNGTIDNNPHAGLRIFLSRMIPYFQFKRQEIEAMRGDSTHINLLRKLSDFKKDDSVSKTQNSGARVEYCLSAGGRVAVACSGSCDKYSYSTLISSYNTTTPDVSPLLQTNWHQNAPYNQLYESGCNSFNAGCYSNSNYSAGCVPISEAQVIAYFYGKNPTRYGADWQAISNNPGCTYTDPQFAAVSALVKAVYDHYEITFKTCAAGTFTFNREI